MNDVAGHFEFFEQPGPVKTRWLAVPCALLNETIDCGEQFLPVNWLRNVVIHARLKALFALAFERMCRERDDGRVALELLFGFADNSSGFKTIHFRHL